jgi:hypothetical protein
MIGGEGGDETAPILALEERRQPKMRNRENVLSQKGLSFRNPILLTYPEWNPKRESIHKTQKKQINSIRRNAAH